MVSGRSFSLSTRHGARPESAPRRRLSFTLIVEGSDLLRVRKAIVCAGGRAVESLRYGPVCGSTCMRLCIGLEAGCEIQMNRIVRSVEADGFGRVVSG